jgi:hypothetical protein
MSTRRAFLAACSSPLLAPRTLLAQILTPAPTTRPNIAQIDHDRILAAAAVTISPPTMAQPAFSPEFLAFTLSLPALAAATLIDAPNALRYNASAAAQLQAWFATPETRLPSAPALKSFEPILDLAPLAEVAVALPFLQLDPTLLTAVKQWFAGFLAWLTTNRTALLARDERNHHASSWLLQTSAFAVLTRNDAALDENRHRFKTSTIRAQIDANGLFPHELPTENPYRNSLFNLDMLAGVANLLSTRFESVWDHELQDGPGMRSAIARHAFYIRDRIKWPYPADATHFALLPCRRPALVFAGRAFAQADYVTLWRSLTPAQPADPDLLRSFPIRQPILWLPQSKLTSP